ncbi:MAG TPA: M28 family metallopeptidase, partial [Pyrinomonadaceae bacterium]
MSAKPSILAAAALLTAALLAPAAPRAPQPGRGGATPAQAQRPGGATPFSGERAYEHVKKLVGFGPRPAGSRALAAAREYIVAQLGGREALRARGRGRSAPSLEEDEWTADTPAGKVKMVNVVYELPGETRDVIIVAGHYDTKRFGEFDFVGANDGGSSAGALLEAARAARDSGGRRRFTYRFVFFDGEEAVCHGWDECGKPGAPDNTYGSRRYVARLRASDQLGRVRALVLLDMVGYERLELGRDEMSTPWLLDVIWRAAKDLGYSRQFVERPEAVGGDDHEPFLRAGVPAADLIQLGTYPHWHTAEDTLDKIAPASLKAVGDVVLASLPRIEERLRAAAADGKRGGRGR